MPCYPNYGLYQKNRAITLRQANHRCQFLDCENSAKQAHHIDGDETNHALDNLLAVCCGCHRRLHYKLTFHKHKNRKVYGCKFCAHQSLNWRALFMHSLAVHPAEYTAVQNWLDGKTPSQEEALIDEWNTFLLDNDPISGL